MTIIIRTDSSSVIGTGHIMRDLVLAGQFSEAKIIFAVQDLPGNINHKIKERDYILETLASNHIETFIPIVEKYHPDMIVIDHYGIDERYEKQLKEKYPNIKLMVLDDTYERHHCDIVLNHNIYADKGRYKNLIPKQCELRCGKEFTLLREEFHTIPLKQKKPAAKIKNVLISMGGTDHLNISTKLIYALEIFTDLTIDIVSTGANPHIGELQKIQACKNNITLHVNIDYIAQLMYKADLAIVSPSVTMNEIFYLEIPFISIKTANNQNEMHDYLIRGKYIALDTFNKKKFVEVFQNIYSGGINV